MLENEHLSGANKWVLLLVLVGDDKNDGFCERHKLAGVLRGLRLWRKVELWFIGLHGRCLLKCLKDKLGLSVKVEQKGIVLE